MLTFPANSYSEIRLVLHRKAELLPDEKDGTEDYLPRRASALALIGYQQA
jgi:hypothetical protein